MDSLMQTLVHRTSSSVVLFDHPYNDPDEGTRLEFRLTYEGHLLGASKTHTRASHKHDIRKVFHPQLKRLWEITPHLSSARDPLPQSEILVNGERNGPPRKSMLAELADRFVRNGFRFIPLATEDLSLICGIEILFLRPDHPGAVLRSGDIDNRLKTLFDALRIPSIGELGNHSPTPTDDEDPFYVLLEDDKLVTRLSVETDTLLQPTGEKPNRNDARLVITVKLRPAELSWKNIVFG